MDSNPGSSRRLPRIIVCNRFEAARVLCRTGSTPVITHVISIGSADEAAPDGFEVHRGPKLRMTFDDTTKAKGSKRPPSREEIEEIIDFVNDIRDSDSVVLMHCGGGLSRSPAIAYVALCTWLGAGEEGRAASLLAEIRPGSVPNRRVVE